MATVTFFSDSEEFLQGLATGIEYVNDGGIELEGEIKRSSNTQYKWMLVVNDVDADIDQHQYYNGSSLDYCEYCS
tara:strand:+ start:166 stop:390 length:225 start_codon:yes stop_codon:yes gene_type:complete